MEPTEIFIDSHTHFDLILEESKETEETLLQEMYDRSCLKAVQVAIDIDNLAWSRDFALRNREKGILFTAGIHPSSPADDEALLFLEKFIEDAQVSDAGDLLFGIGECGLDFFRMRQPEKMQRASFSRQINMAKKYNLPVIVHARDAWKETMEILRAHKVEKGIMHCFPGDRDAAREALDLGFYLSFAGNVTFKKAVHLQEAAAFTPPERLLVETDAPFLTPVPHRGKPNRTHFVAHTYQFIADLKNIPLEDLKKQVYNNFQSITAPQGDK